MEELSERGRRRASTTTTSTKNNKTLDGDVGSNGRKGTMQSAFESCFGISHGWDFLELRGSQKSNVIGNSNEGSSSSNASLYDDAAGSFRINLLCTDKGQGARSKDLQFVYVNRRFVKSKRIQKLMNDLMATAAFGSGRYTSTSMSLSSPSSGPKA